MDLQAITLMEAYIIENLRKHGVTNDEIIEINEQAIEQWMTLNDRFDYTILAKLAKQSGAQFSSIINKGYKVKFLTLNGLINLIQLKLGKNRDADFVVHEDGVSSLVLDENELHQVKQFLSPNWTVLEQDNGISIRSR